MKQQSISARSAIADKFACEAESFVTKHAARVLLRMPGCREVFVNDAHRRTFRVHFETVSSTAQARKSLQGERRLARDKDLFKDTPCYCYPMDAIIALIGKHCVFERSLTLLARKPGEPRDDIAAFLFGQNGKREYHLYLTTSKRFDGEESSYLDTEFMKLSGVSVTVHTKKAVRGAARVLSARTTLGSSDFVPVVEKSVEKEEGYQSIFQVIADTMCSLSKHAGLPDEAQQRILSDSKAELLQRIESHRGVVDYEAVRGFVNGIYGFALGFPKRNKNISEVVWELGRIQDRLFDANVVVDGAIEAILDKIAGWPKLKIQDVST